MNPLGGTLGAAERFHGSQQTGYGAFNPFSGATGILGTWQITPDFRSIPSGQSPSRFIDKKILGGTVSFPNPAYPDYLEKVWDYTPGLRPTWRFVPSATLACSLMQQSGSSCTYSCSSSGPFLTNTFERSLGELQQACPGGGALISCPLSISARESLGMFQITGCSQ